MPGENELSKSMSESVGDFGVCGYCGAARAANTSVIELDGSTVTPVCARCAKIQFRGV